MPIATPTLRSEERSLLHDLRAGQNDAFRRLQESLGPAVLHYLRTRFKGLDPEDLYQETLLKVWRSTHSFDGTQGSLRSWVFAIARNTAIDRLRADPKCRARLEENFRTYAREHADFIRRKTEIQSVLAEADLPPLGRRVVEADLQRFPETDDAGLAAELGTSAASIQVQRSKAFKRLGLAPLKRREALKWLAADGESGQARLLGLRTKAKEQDHDQGQ